MSTAARQHDRPESASERLVVMLPPSQKRELERRARNAGVSTSAFVRDAIEAYEPEAAKRDTELEQLVEALNESTREAHAALDEAFAELARTRTQLRRTSAD